MPMTVDTARETADYWQRETDRLLRLAERWQQRALAAEARLAELGVPRGQCPYDRDPQALAWARAHVQRIIDFYRSDWHKRRQQFTSPVVRAMRLYLMEGGHGEDGVPVIAAFDARKPRLSRELAEREARR